MAAPHVALSVEELSARLGALGTRPSVVENAAKVLWEASRVWQPKIVYRWLNIEKAHGKETTLTCPLTGESSDLSLGFSNVFIKKARKALVGVYTVGRDFESAGAAKAMGGQVFDAYLYDIIGLAVLQRLGEQVNSIIEQYAAGRGWGVSPVLSPGSVHGWAIEDQPDLCTFLPLESIGVEIGENCILRPFKSLSFLIGTGPELESAEVGTTCEVCLKKDTCEMRTK